MRPSKPISVSAAASSLGVPRRWLVRRLQRLERDTGVDLLVPCAGETRNRYSVSLSRLRRHLPELFDAETERDDVLTAMQALMKRLERQLATLDDRLDATEQRLAAIHVHLTTKGQSFAPRKTMNRPQSQEHR